MKRLSISPERQGVVSLPCLSSSSGGLGESMTLAQATGLLASCSKATRFAVLMNRVDNPVDAGISADSLVLRVNEDDFVVLEGRVLVDPVGVENPKVGGFAISSTLWHRSLATTTSHTDTVDHIALLGLVTQTTGLVWSGRSRCAVDDIQLSELPAADSEKESKDIGLLLLVKFFDVLECTHLDCCTLRRTGVGGLEKWCPH